MDWLHVSPKVELFIGMAIMKWLFNQRTHCDMGKQFCIDVLPGTPNDLPPGCI